MNEPDLVIASSRNRDEAKQKALAWLDQHPEIKSELKEGEIFQEVVRVEGGSEFRYVIRRTN